MPLSARYEDARHRCPWAMTGANRASRRAALSEQDRGGGRGPRLFARLRADVPGVGRYRLERQMPAPQTTQIIRDTWLRLSHNQVPINLKGQEGAVAQLMSVNVGLPKDIPWKNRSVYTGAWKTPV